MPQATDWKVWQQPDVARAFTQRRKTMPGQELQRDMMAWLISRLPAGPLAILDLGCGDGFLLAEALSLRPGSQGIGLDGSPDMIKQARIALAPIRPEVMLVHADFNDPTWPTRLPPVAPDLVISGFAIHHSEDDQKRAVYTAVHALLKPGGLFINLEHVASATPLGEELFEEMWAQWVVAVETSAGREAQYEQTLANHRASPEKASNRLAPPEVQLQWLRNIGFQHVDCYFRYHELALLAGYKQGEP